ncbi:hypothetical protein [Maledivibacter halophilus]|uniref:Uncharacterized protein n=1 Tax=Maledivibacter halophilus TaxID=36842 RepID=A0A1T5M8M1_9FIRM|nr:hypothetical protein [Maledivibacter halophilus]SKC84591.1 hypothetical protein SAMN02194393_04176 [Maledivibacter halophilus]
MIEESYGENIKIFKTCICIINVLMEVPMGLKKRLEQDLLCEKLRCRVKYFITKYRKTHDEEKIIKRLVAPLK